MTTTSNPLSDRSMAAQRRGGLRIFAWAILVVSIPNLFVVLFAIPRFAVNFRDMFGDRPLPVFTAAIIHGRWMLIGLGCLWPFAAFCLAPRVRSALFLGAILTVVIAQMLITIFLLFVPLITVIQTQQASQ